MPLFFYTEGDGLLRGQTSCNETPRKFKSISLPYLKSLTRNFLNRTRATDMPEDLQNRLIVGCRFPLKEVEMLIRQSPDAEFLQVNYAIEDNEKHFHYMLATKAGVELTVDENSLIIEDCCRIPPNTVGVQELFS